MEPAIFFASFLFFPIQVPSLYSFPLIASGLRPNGIPISRCSALTMPHFLQDVSPYKSITHVCLPPTGQIESEANSYERCLCKINILGSHNFTVLRRIRFFLVELVFYNTPKNPLAVCFESCLFLVSQKPVVKVHLGHPSPPNSCPSFVQPLSQ